MLRILLTLVFMMSSASIFASEASYQLCSGNFPNQSCQTFSSKEQCVAKLKACQDGSNQVKPWLCGSCESVREQGDNQNVLPPAYLSVKGFKQCLDTKNMGTWQSYCLPESKPNACDDDVWLKLSNMNLPKCSK